MTSLRSIISASLALAGVLSAQAAEELLKENFDSLTPETVIGQDAWADNSKTGEALIVPENSLSTPNHLQVSNGGAVHHALSPWTETPKEIALEFAFKRQTETSGNNLQISLRGNHGEPVLFLNIRGSGKAVDIGISADQLAEHFTTTDLPKHEWNKAKIVWPLEAEQLQIQILSEDGQELLNENIEMPLVTPIQRIIIGGTSKTITTEEWAIDDLLIEARP